jgi:Anti-sigma-D factor RsdA to sigma factor binding region
VRNHRHGENRFGDEPSGHGRPPTNGTNGVHPAGMGIPTIALREPRPGEDNDPVDIVAVQADDELINALAFGMSVTSSGGSDLENPDDHISAVLAAWRAEVDADPIPELIDVDTAVAAVMAARRPVGRVRRLAPVAAAAAFLVITAGGLVGSYSAEPQDVLWPVAKVFYAERTDSVEAAARVEQRIAAAKQAIAAGQPDVAAQLLQAAAADLGVVRPEEGGVQLAAVQDFLVAKAEETPPGVPTDPGAPLVGDQARQVPAGAAISVPARVTEPSTSVGGTTTDPGSTAPTQQDSGQLAPPAPADPQVARVLPQLAPAPAPAPAPPPAPEPEVIPAPDPGRDSSTEESGTGGDGPGPTSSTSDDPSVAPVPPADGSAPALDQLPDVVPEIANSLGATAADTSTTAPPPAS